MRLAITLTCLWQLWKVIDIDHTTVVAKLEAMISGWLYSGKATWDNLINALVKTGVILSYNEDLPCNISYYNYPSSLSCFYS